MWKKLRTWDKGDRIVVSEIKSFKTMTWIYIWLDKIKYTEMR
jgi:hypothetical protein